MINLININANKSNYVIYYECFNINYKGFNGKYNALINNRLITRYLISIITD